MEWKLCYNINGGMNTCQTGALFVERLKLAVQLIWFHDFIQKNKKKERESKV